MNNNHKVSTVASIAQNLGRAANENETRPQPDDIVEYFRRIRQGEDVGHQKHTIAGNLERWHAFDWAAHPDLLSAKRTIVEWSKTQEPRGGGLVLAGDTGSGKSHIAQAVAKARGFGARYVNELELIKTIQSTYGGGDETEAGILFRLAGADLLVYDDLGAYEGKNLEWIQGIYYTLFNGRHEAGRATLITTNYPLIDHAGGSPLEERVGVRTFSRILGQVGSRRYFIDLFRVPDYRVRGFSLG